MTEALPTLRTDLALREDMIRNFAEIAPSGCNDASSKSAPFGDETLEITPQASETVASKRGHVRHAGPSLKILLTQNFPDGATAEVLARAGFRGDLVDARKRGNVKEHDGRYFWLEVSAPKVTDATELRGLFDPLASQPAAPVVNPAHLNQEDVPTERFRIEEIALDRIKVSARRRALDPAKVEAIGELMERIGLQTPIMVYKTAEGGFELIVGLHRYAAAKSRSWAKITCYIVQMNDLTRQLWEIDENLCRAELNEVERAEHLAAPEENL